MEEPDDTSWSKGFPHIGVTKGDEKILAENKIFDASSDEFYWYSAILSGSTLGFIIYDINRDIKMEISGDDNTYTIGKTGIGKDPRDWENSDAFVDAVLIRKYTPIEPTVVIGPENLFI